MRRVVLGGMLVGIAAWTLSGVPLGAQAVTATQLLDGLRDPARRLTYSGDYSAQRHSPLLPK